MARWNHQLQEVTFLIYGKEKSKSFPKSYSNRDKKKKSYIKSEYFQLEEDQIEKLELKEGLEKKNRYMLAKIAVIGKGSEEVIRVFMSLYQN